MRRLVMLSLLLLAIPLFSQSSSEPESGSTICFTQSQLDEMEAEANQIMEDAVAEAVAETNKVHLNIEADLKEEIASLNCQLKGWRIAAFSSLGVGLALALALAILF